MRSAEYCGEPSKLMLLRSDIRRLDESMLELLMHPCKNMTSIDAKDVPLIIGAGGLGLHGIGWAKILTDCNVVVAEPDESKHAAAIEAGADTVLNTGGDDALEIIQEATGGGPHAVIDFVGMPATSGLGRDALRKGGTQVQVGLFEGEAHMDHEIVWRRGVRQDVPEVPADGRGPQFSTELVNPLQVGAEMTLLISHGRDEAMLKPRWRIGKAKKHQGHQLERE